MAKIPKGDDFLFEWLNADAGAFFRRGRQLESVATPYQRLDVYETPGLGRMFRLDDCNMTSEKDEFFYHENLVHPGALAQDAPRSALVVGGGDGGAIEELFKHPSIERVVMAELDAGVVRMAQAHFESVHRGALTDRRLEIRIGDGFACLRETTEKFDLVLMDLTDPAGPAESLYTTEFYRAAARVLHPTGTLALHLGPPFFDPERFIAGIRCLAEVFAIVRPYFVHIPLYGASWAMACVSQRTDPLLLSAHDIDTRITQRGLGRLRYFNGDVHRAGFAQPNFIRELVVRGMAAPDGT